MTERTEEHVIDWEEAVAIVRGYAQYPPEHHGDWLDEDRAVRLIGKQDDGYGDLFGVALKITSPTSLPEGQRAKRRMACWEEHCPGLGAIPYTDKEILERLRELYFLALDAPPGHATQDTPLIRGIPLFIDPDGQIKPPFNLDLLLQGASHIFPSGRAVQLITAERLGYLEAVEAKSLLNLAMD